MSAVKRILRIVLHDVAYFYTRCWTTLDTSTPERLNKDKKRQETCKNNGPEKLFFGYNSVTLQTDIGHGHVRDIMEKKRFCFILYSKFRQKIYPKERAVKKRLGLSYIHSRQGTIDIRSRRGSGLFISERAFGDASNKINCTSSCAFFMSQRQPAILIGIGSLRGRAWHTHIYNKEKGQNDVSRRQYDKGRTRQASQGTHGDLVRCPATLWPHECIWHIPTAVNRHGAADAHIQNSRPRLFPRFVTRDERWGPLICMKGRWKGTALNKDYPSSG